MGLTWWAFLFKKKDEEEVGEEEAGEGEEEERGKGRGRKKKKIQKTQFSSQQVIHCITGSPLEDLNGLEQMSPKQQYQTH